MQKTLVLVKTPWHDKVGSIKVNTELLFLLLITEAPNYMGISGTLKWIVCLWPWQEMKGHPLCILMRLW